jgi:RNase H-fold protein (predicted Holliday junction resolvase)
MEMDEDLRKPVVFVVGIDFGTSSSGFAFSKISDTTDSIYRIAKFSFQKFKPKVTQEQV